MGLPIQPALLDVVNPLRVLYDEAFDRTLRRYFFRDVQFTEPAGDAGWFGPGSAVWHVHEHAPLLMLGLNAAATIETLHPDFAWMGNDHTRSVQRDENGAPTGRLDPDGMRLRGGHSFAFFAGVAYGPTPVAERLTRIVSGMHHRVRGVRPDGRPYDADDPHTLRWAYATVVWGIAAAHERYHLRALGDIDEYYGEFVRVGEALGGTDLPATKADVLACLDAERPMMALTPPAAQSFDAFEPSNHPLPLRPALDLFRWTIYDLQPRWAQRLLRVPSTSAPEKLVRRTIIRAALNGLHYSAGPLREVREARMRASAASAAERAAHGQRIAA